MMAFPKILHLENGVTIDQPDDILNAQASYFQKLYSSLGVVEFHEWSQFLQTYSNTHLLKEAEITKLATEFSENICWLH